MNWADFVVEVAQRVPAYRDYLCRRGATPVDVAQHRAADGASGGST